MSVARCLEILTAGEVLLVAVIARIAPWLPPLPTAWLVYDRTSRYLGWPDWTAGAAAIAVECLGLLTTVTALELYTYNQEKLKTEPRAPLAIPLALVGVYFLVAELLTVGLDLLPRLAAGEGISVITLAPAMFPPLSLVGMLLLATRTDQRRRLAENREEKERRREMWRKRREEQNLTPVTKSAEPGELPKLARERLGQLREMFAPGVQFTRAAVESAFDLKATAAGSLLTLLLTAGELRESGRGRSRRYWFDDR